MPRNQDHTAASGPSSLERQPLLQTPDEEDVIPHDPIEGNGASRDNEQPGSKPKPVWQHQDTFRLLSVIFDFFMMGAYQTAVGALIPDIEHFYNQGDGATASIFVAAMVGYLCATAAIEQIHLRLGRRGIALLSPSIRLLAAGVLSTGPSFHVALAAYFLFGFGTALVDAGWCAWASSLPYANICQGFMHGAFSTGCVFGPMASLAVLKNGFEWYGFYRFATVPLGLEFVAQGLAFRHDNAAKYRMTRSNSDEDQSVNPFKTRAVWMCGLFFFIYVGIESSFSDWIILFMRRVRHYEPLKASLSSSSFWTGMAIGRLLLGFVTQYFGLGISITAYIIFSTTLQILFRTIQNDSLSLVLLGLNGFFCGPLFPSGILLLAAKLPQKAHVGAVAAAAAMGQIGGAVAPLGIGLLADRFGMGHLLDVVLALSVSMLVVWILFSRIV
ncbi:hypothetical protein H2200_007580 [Cladophialophora chaetospira]|uniref:Major facilitator superfamily (MFS) profile domain-containing protein n=1 Tax=Cladophialophora chaetospira TaxID=386627 RepID=A0AA38X611_9EURO|nr:hypothetical protein H2200_007580 [Cladophialophora chaetospira]